MPRVSSKQKYIVQTFELFKTKGLSLNMEQIAVELGLTKKTLYNNFRSKHELIGTILNYFYEGLDNKIQDYTSKSVNAIEGLFEVSRIISDEISQLGTLLMKDVSKFQSSPEIFSFTYRKNFYSKILKENLNRGISEGLYRENINPDYCTLFYTSAIELFYRWDGSFKYMDKTAEYHEELVKHHLYSVVNSKGAKVLESYLKFR